MNPTANPQIAPGVGYRLLKSGEVVKAGDERLYQNSWRPRPSSDAGQAQDTAFICYPTRRKLAPWQIPPSTPAPAPSLSSSVAKLEADLMLSQSNYAVTLKNLAKASAELQKASAELQKANDELDLKDNTITGLEATINRLHAQLKAVQQNASGNAVLVRQDGFSKPISVAPWVRDFRIATFPQDKPCFMTPEQSVFARFATVDFLRTGQTDGFGRTIYKEAA